MTEPAKTPYRQGDESPAQSRSETDPGYRTIRAALMFLLSRAREALDGGRPLTEAESELLRDVGYWWQSSPWQQPGQNTESAASEGAPAPRHNPPSRRARE